MPAWHGLEKWRLLCGSDPTGPRPLFLFTAALGACGVLQHDAYVLMVFRLNREEVKTNADGREFPAER